MSVRVRVRVSQVRLRALEGRRACPRVACASACAAPKYPGGVTRNTLNFPYPVGLQKTRYNLPERPTLALRQRSDSTRAERDTKAAVKAHGTRRAAIAAILLGGLHLRLELPVALAELGLSPKTFRTTRGTTVPDHFAGALAPRPGAKLITFPGRTARA